MTHTSGLSYEFWNADILRYMEAKGIPSLGTLSRDCLFTPLIADPGETWEYGISFDWLGQVIEAIAGQDIDPYMAENLFAPMGMKRTVFTLTPDLTSRMAAIHVRNARGALESTDIIGEQNGDFKEGGGGLSSTSEDVMRFIRMVLNKGAVDGGRILSPESVSLLTQNATGKLPLKRLETTNAEASLDFEFFPGLRKSWTLGMMRNETAAPTGRSAGSCGWGGLFNTYYWIDPERDIGGILSTQLLPFADETSLEAFYGFETRIYDAV